MTHWTAAVALVGIIYTIIFLALLALRTYLMDRKGQVSPTYYGNWDKPHDWDD